MLRRRGNLKTYNPEDTEMIKGKADANQALIYAKAYDKSIQSKILYGYLKSRRTFEKTFDGKTSIFISTDCELYKSLKKMERRSMKK
ncbi:hypothetical protein BST83_07385 [Polaribacter filamentus]|uniref:Uncharacterized protein n=1 Tax=Polaribacter filamentus TaxID=53483 RepID=A0A2S7KWG5_9FLAO|nr:hypothetical protein BST83_07385 [Polaribacter filamentus]